MNALIEKVSVEVNKIIKRSINLRFQKKEIPLARLERIHRAIIEYPPQYNGPGQQTNKFSCRSAG